MFFWRLLDFFSAAYNLRPMEGIFQIYTTSSWNRKIMIIYVPKTETPLRWKFDFWRFYTLLQNKFILMALYEVKWLLLIMIRRQERFYCDKKFWQSRFWSNQRISNYELRFLKNFFNDFFSKKIPNYVYYKHSRLVLMGWKIRRN